MYRLLADLDPQTFWNGTHGSGALIAKIVITLIVGFLLVALLTRVPPPARRPIVAFVTFFSGLFYVLAWIYPSPINRGPTDAPRNTAEAVSFWIADTQPVLGHVSNVVSGLLLGLGVYSLLRVHLSKIAKKQTDWGFSLVLIVSMLAMAIFGYIDFIQRWNTSPRMPDGPDPSWGIAQYGSDLLFYGLYVNMDSTMFSMIAFFILSAAYRAFRARSVEATILLISALVVILSLMGLVAGAWDNGALALANSTHVEFFRNFGVSSISDWLKNTIQVPSVRGIDFGLGLGIMAMGLRLWLSLERLGGEA